MTGRGDDRKLMDWLACKGYSVVRSARTQHWKIYKGERLVAVTSGTPSDWRSRHNLLKDLRRQT